MNKATDKNEYISKMVLKDRGWTETSIKKILGKPDLYRNNPVYKNAPKKCLYSIKRVVEAEEGNDFKEWKEKYKKRLRASKKMVKTKKDNILKEIDGWEITVNYSEDIVDEAINSYNDRVEALKRYDYADFTYASRDSNKAFLDRITVNFIRHQLTEYDDKLFRLCGKTGVKRSYIELNKKIYLAIPEKYPELKDECDLQWGNKIDDYNIWEEQNKEK